MDKAHNYQISMPGWLDLRGLKQANTGCMAYVIAYRSKCPSSTIPVQIVQLAGRPSLRVGLHFFVTEMI